MQSKIARQLCEEHTLSDDTAFAHFTFLEVSDLPLKGHDTHTRGKVAEFLERLNPSGSFKISLIYRTIADEVRRKNNYHSDVLAFDGFVREKAIGRSTFTDILKRVGAYEDIESLWRRIEARLNTEQVPVFMIRKLHDHFRRFAIDRVSQTDVTLKRLQDSVRRHLAAAEEQVDSNTLVPLLESAVAAIRADSGAREYLRYDDDYIKALALATLYEE